VDSFFLENFGRADAFPSGGDLDQNAVARNAVLLIDIDELASLGDAALRVERKARISLGGDPPWDDLKDFQAEGYEDVIDDILDLRMAGETGAFAIRENLVEDIGIGGLGRGLENETGIGSRVLRLELPHGFEIAGVRDDFREFLKLIELAQLRGGWLGDCVAHNVS
jgi:hypothetical protein